MLPESGRWRPHSLGMQPPHEGVAGLARYAAPARVNVFRKDGGERELVHRDPSGAVAAAL